jgi:hypothetical protein
MRFARGANVRSYERREQTPPVDTGRYAVALVDRLAPDRVPAPLDGVLASA